MKFTEYQQICEDLDLKYKKLMDFTVETFILNPEIAELTNEIKILKQRKAELEDILNEEKD